MLGANVKVKETHIKMIICIVGRVSAGETQLCFSTRIQSCVCCHALVPEMYF